MWLSYMDCTNESNVIWSQFVHKSEEVRQEIAGLHGEIKRMTEHVELTEKNGSGWKQNTGKQTRAAYTREKNAKNKYPSYKNKEAEKVLKRTQHNHQMAANKAPIPKYATTHTKREKGDNTQTTDEKNKNLERNEAAAKRYADEAKNAVRDMGFTTFPELERTSPQQRKEAVEQEAERREEIERDEQELRDMSADATDPTPEEEEADRQKASLMSDREKRLQHAKRIEEARIKNEEERERIRR